MLIILASIFAVLLVLGLPIAFTMGIACIGAVIYSGMPMNMMITRMFSAADSFSLMAVPFFILAGELMNEALPSLIFLPVYFLPVFPAQQPQIQRHWGLWKFP